MRRFRVLLLALGLAAPGLPLVGCGGDAPTAASRGSGRSSKAKPKKAESTAAAGEVDLSRLPPKLRDIDWKAQDDLAESMRETRDPFKPYVEDLLEAKPCEGNDCPTSPTTSIEGVIADTPVEALQLIAIITGGAVHKAMVTDNRGLGHIVRPGDIVGSAPQMRLVRITRNEVLFRALEAGPDEEKPREVRKALLSQEELQELLP